MGPLSVERGTRSPHPCGRRPRCWVLGVFLGLQEVSGRARGVKRSQEGVGAMPGDRKRPQGARPGPFLRVLGCGHTEDLSRGTALLSWRSSPGSRPLCWRPCAEPVEPEDRNSGRGHPCRPPGPPANLAGLSAIRMRSLGQAAPAGGPLSSAVRRPHFCLPTLGPLPTSEGPSKAAT